MKLNQRLFTGAQATNSEVVITEIGGTVGDIESLPFLEAIRQARKILDIIIHYIFIIL